jgi:hypothetical protein
MHKNRVWQGFLAIVFISTLWYSGVAWYAYWHYTHLTASTTTSSVTEGIEEKSEEHYVLKASYQYKVQGQLYAGSFVFNDEPYRNRWSAEQAVHERSQKEWTVWFDPEDPYYSSLQKNFPFKECVSAIFLWGLLLYFLWLGFYVSRFRA